MADQLPYLARPDSNPQPRSVNSVACCLDIAQSSIEVVMCSPLQHNGFTSDVSRFVCRRRSHASLSAFLGTGMAPFPDQAISAVGDLEITLNLLIASFVISCDMVRTLGARSNERGVVRRESDEKEGRCLAGKGVVVGLRIAEQRSVNVTCLQCANQKAPHFTLRTLFSTLFYPCYRQTFLIASQSTLPHIDICLYIAL
jgi:hypothetical protein